MMRWFRGFLGALLVLGMAFTTQVRSESDEKKKIEAAKARVKILTDAVEVYHFKHGQYPPKLQALVDAKFVMPEAVIDPWKKEYKYDPAGKKNQGKRPDIWTVTPDKKTIGNWP